jgi:hypothetical protein
MWEQMELELHYIEIRELRMRSTVWYGLKAPKHLNVGGCFIRMMLQL